MAARATAVLPVAVAASTTPLQPANSQALSALICQSRNGYRTIQRLTSRRFACLIGCAGTRSLLRTKPQRGHVETLVDAGRSHRGQACSSRAESAFDLELSPVLGVGVEAFFVRFEDLQMEHAATGAIPWMHSSSGLEEGSVIDDSNECLSHYPSARTAALLCITDRLRRFFSAGLRANRMGRRPLHRRRSSCLGEIQLKIEILSHFRRNLRTDAARRSGTLND